MKQTRTVHVGLAIARDHITAYARRGAQTSQHAVELDPSARDFAGAMMQLREQLVAVFGAGPVDGARVAIALLPPLAETRLLNLPPLRPAEADAVVRRDAGRYFIGVPAPRVTAVQVGGGLPVLAGAAEAPLLDALHAAVLAAGWRVDSITTAYAAWIDVAVRLDAAQCTVVAVHADTAHIIRVVGGRAVEMRRVPASEHSEIVAAAEGGAAGAGRNVVLLTDESERAALTRRFTDAGWSVAPRGGTAPDAAMQHAAAGRLRLATASMAAGQRTRARRTAMGLAFAAVVLIVAAAAVELWGANRELDAVRGRRAEIRAQVSPLLALRDSIDRLDTQAADVEAASRAAPRWTAALFDLALLLPSETWLTRLYATGDTLIVDAQGERAGAALQALRGSGALRETRLVGVVDRELADGATSSERFRIRARVEAP